MSSPTNTYNPTTSADYLAELRQYVNQQKAGQTANQNFTLSYGIPIYPDLCRITDSATVNLNQSPAADLCNCTDSATNTTAATGQWEIPLDAANSTGVINPIIEVGCFDVGF